MISHARVETDTPLKACCACGIRKPLSNFHRHSGHKDGRASRCKECNAQKGRDWYLKKQRDSGGLYSTWAAMKQRCHYEKHDNYGVYGGRGIHVCEEWRESFKAFRCWAEKNGYRSDLQLDRIDNDKGYGPNNCRFVSVSENMRNKRRRDIPLRNYTRLTPADVREIRRLLASGVTQRAIGRKFTVSHATIGAINTGKTWTDVK